MIVRPHRRTEETPLRPTPRTISTFAALTFFASHPSLDPATAADVFSDEPPYTLSEPLGEAKVLRPGQLCTGDYEAYPSFTADGRSLFFVKSSPDFTYRTIVESNYLSDWSIPRTPPFSGWYDDTAPFLTADGSKLYFASNRPASSGGSPQSHMDLWVVERTDGTWGPARPLSAAINGPGNETSVSVAADGTIYFSSDRPGGQGGLDLYRCSMAGGKPGKVENLGPTVNTPENEIDPRLAADGSFLIFASRGHRDGIGGYDLCVSKPTGSTWAAAENLGGRINSVRDDFGPCLAPGGKYLFWTSTRSFADVVPERAWQYPELLGRIRMAKNGLGDIYQLELSALGIKR
jgi:WD40-like Beta Propeller Repeat